MRLKNVGIGEITIKNITLKRGETSENIDDDLARKLVLDYRGLLGIAPESEHTDEELQHADEKDQDHPIEWAVDPVQFIKEGGTLHK